VSAAQKRCVEMKLGSFPGWGVVLCTQKNPSSHVQYGVLVRAATPIENVIEAEQFMRRRVQLGRQLLAIKAEPYV